MNRNGSQVSYEERLELLSRIERRRVRFPDESVREACRAVDPDFPDALRSMYRRRRVTREEVRLQSAREQLQVDVAAVVSGMTDGELARLAENVRQQLKIRGIEMLLEDESGVSLLDRLSMPTWDE